jgi:hypothetical protein
MTDAMFISTLIARQSAAHGRGFMFRNGQLVSWVPENATPGHVINVMTRAHVPKIFRPGTDGYSVVGDAYVHGGMDGETMTPFAPLEYLSLREAYHHRSSHVREQERGLKLR